MSVKAILAEQGGKGGGSGANPIVLSRIKVATQPTKTSYLAGEEFDTTGMTITADYAFQGVEAMKDIEVTGYTYSPQTLSVSTTQVVISYTENGVTRTATVDVIVAKKQITVPTQSGSLVYNQNSQEPSWNGYNTTYMQLGGETTATAAGNYTATFTLLDSDLYEWADGTATATKNVTWVIAQATASLSTSVSSVTLDSDNLTATFTISGTYDGTLNVVSNDTSIATVDRGGNTVTVSSVNETTGNTTITVSVSGGSNYTNPSSVDVIVQASFLAIYGATWDGTSTTKWARTDAAVTFVDPVPYVAGASSYSSPFDTISPWKDMKRVTDSEAGELVEIPKFYYKLEQKGAGMSIQISMKKEEGFSTSPAHMDRGDGKGERSVAYIGRYHCATSTYKSTSGVNPQAYVTRANFRTNIHNLGSTIWQNDFAMRFTIWLLYIVEFADWNSQATIGKGCGNNSGVQTMGYTDSMPYHTGTTQSSRDTYGLGTQYRYIEGLWDNIYDWIDGCYNSSAGLNLIKNPANFSDSSGGTAAGTPSGGWPAAFTVSSSGGFTMFYASATGGSETTYSCDHWNFNASAPCVFGSGSYSQNGNYGLFHMNCSSATSQYVNPGSRLQKLP